MEHAFNLWSVFLTYLLFRLTSLFVAGNFYNWGNTLVSQYYSFITTLGTLVEAGTAFATLAEQRRSRRTNCLFRSRILKLHLVLDSHWQYHRRKLKTLLKYGFSYIASHFLCVDLAVLCRETNLKIDKKSMKKVQIVDKLEFIKPSLKSVYFLLYGCSKTQQQDIL